MKIPENSPNQELEADMLRPMIGVRMHMSDFDKDPANLVVDVSNHGQLVQPDPLVLSSGRLINKRYSRAIPIGETPVDIEGDCITSSDDVASPNQKTSDIRSKKVLLPVALTLGASLVAAACASLLTSEGSQETLQPLPTNESTMPTLVETTTPTEPLEVGCNVDISGRIVVESGQNMTEIATACNRTLGELMAWNALTDADDIDAGQLLIVTPPTTTTTTIPLAPEITTTTVAVVAEVSSSSPDTVPTETVAVETTPPETVPVETAPPETAPPANAISPPPQSNDVFLSEELCSQYGGAPHRFELGETLTEYLLTLGLTSEQANRVASSKELMNKFMLTGVTASTEGLSGAECVPKWPAMKHLFA